MTKKFFLIMFSFLTLFGQFVFCASPAYASDLDAVKPGEFVVEPATLINLGFEWYVDGDDNHNATVEVTYRETGTTEWKNALPFLRINREQGSYTFSSGISWQYTAPNMFAGSILDLKEDTEYECKFVMSDPDGVQGENTQTVTVRTRPEPKPAEGGNVYHVYPPDWRGTKEQPAFSNLMQAYYVGYAESDFSTFARPRVQPGDTILVHAGLYKDNRFTYGADLSGGGMGTPFDGTYYLTASGTEEKPIVIKSAGDGEVIFDGDGNHTLFNVMGTNYNYFEGLTIINTNVAFMAGVKNIAGASGLTVKNCRLRDIGIGVHTDWSGSKNFYIGDNEFIGREDQDKLMGWYGAIWTSQPGYPALLKSYYGVKVYGSGHVVCNNYVAYFHDGIDVATYGLPDGYPGEIIRDRMPVAIDFYNNDIHVMADNFIETDGGMYNIRVLRNRNLNVAAAAISMQPIYGGPVYWIRNVVYHAPNGGTLKLVCDPSGGFFFNNTFASEASAAISSNMHFRNNLILAENPTARVFSATQHTNYSSSDYNGFALAPNPSGGTSFQWNTPPFNVLTDYFGGGRVTRNFATLEEYSAATGQDTHSILIDWNVFWNAWAPDRNKPTEVFTPDQLDFQLKSESAAVDAGMVIPNVNDDYTGEAPDLGAYEIGKPLPVYGPRWRDSANPLKLSTDAFHVKQDGYANLTTEFIEPINSNTAILYYTFDTDLFEYADFHPANGVSVVSKEATPDGAKVVVMISDYNTQAYGDLAIHAKADVPLKNGFAIVNVKAMYVLKNDAGEKAIRTASASTSFTTRGNGDKPFVDGDTNDDGVVDIIDLSNIIDWFGTGSDDPDWNNLYTFFDFNNDGEIGIYDISYIAQLIK